MKKLAFVLALAASSLALAQVAPGGKPGEPGYSVPHPDSGSRGPMERGMSFHGEVLAIDKLSGTVTLKHDSISALGVPASTGDYAVKDASMLERVKAGDRVRFTAVLQGRSLIVTGIAPAN